MFETEPDAKGLWFMTLGPLAVAREKKQIQLGGPQQRAVLAILLVRRPATVSMSQIADDLWGEHVPPGYARTIRTYVHHLRQVLSGTVPDSSAPAQRAVIVTVDGGYRIDIDDDDVDAALFERHTKLGEQDLHASSWGSALQHFEAALKLWRGETLTDLAHLPFAMDYSRRFAELRMTALGGQIDARLALGEHADVVADLETLTTRYPLDERFHAQRMLALYRCGRQGDALAAYRSAYQLLEDELGVQPGPRLRQINAAILAHDPDLLLAVPNGPSAPASRAATPRRRTIFAAAVAGVAATIALVGTALLATRAQPSEAVGSLPANSVGFVGADGTLHSAVSVDAEPEAVVYADGTLWVASGVAGQVSRVDLGTGRVVQTIPVGRNPAAVAVRGSDAWVANAGDGTVSRINTTTDTVVQTVRVGAVPEAVVSDASGIWVVNSGDDTVQRIDPRTGVTDPPVDVGGGPSGIAAHRGTLWVTNTDDGTVTRLDAGTGQPIGGPVPVGSGPGAAVVERGAVWVADAEDQSVARLDADTGALVAKIRVGDGPTALAVAAGKVWVANSYDGSLSRIDTSTNSVDRRVHTRSSPRGLAPVGTGVWVASSAMADQARRGGTLTVSDNVLPGEVVGIDPSNAYLQSGTVRALRLVYDGLVAYHVGSGPVGMRVVPDLATSVPRPSDGGRTYAFTVRSGVRFSDGSLVRASDIRRGVRRALTTSRFGGGPAQTVGIVGAEHCAGQGLCDLSHGVVVDDATRSIVFHLRAPDPNFLLKLTYFGAATPASAPTTEATSPLPGTGPYRIARFRKGKTFVLTRNPYFRQWSFAAQPDGYVDTIRWVKAASDVTRIAATVAARTDLTRIPAVSDEPGAQQALQDVARSHPAQLHTENPFALVFFYLNPHVPPFDDIRVRRAINLAIDRGTVAGLEGGPMRALPTCQMLPPNFPGYHPYCPFSTGSPRAAYAGPDLPRARLLVGASRTAGMKVVVTSIEGKATSKVADYLVGVLRSLGYAASKNMVSGDDYFRTLQDPRGRLQMVSAPGWLADYPAASNFYDNLFGCRGATAPWLYVDRWCNPAMDRLAKRAHQLEGADPGRSRALWQRVDRRLTDSASMVALVNTLESTVVSSRVGNFQSSSFEGPLLSQLWVR